MENQDRSRIRDAFDELSGYRDDGEDVIENLELVAAFHSVPISKLRELAELKWGGPIETDRERNADHFIAAEQRNAARAEAHAQRSAIIQKTKVAAINVWNSCCPNGEPDWDYCAKRFLSLNKIENVSLRQEVAEIFMRVGKDFTKSVLLYKKWTK